MGCLRRECSEAGVDIVLSMCSGGRCGAMNMSRKPYNACAMPQ